MVALKKKSCLSDAAMLLGAHNCILRILVETDQIFSCTALNSKVHTLRNFVLAHYLNLKSESNMFMMPWNNRKIKILSNLACNIRCSVIV